RHEVAGIAPSFCTTSYHKTAAPFSFTSSSIATVEFVLTTNGTRALAAPRTLAVSPNGCIVFWYAAGANKIGEGNSLPKRETVVETERTSSSTRGQIRTRSKALSLSTKVISFPAPRSEEHT